MKKGLTIGKIRSSLYGAARALGDVQAVEQSYKKGSPEPIERRLAYRAAGAFCSALIRAFVNAAFGRRR